MLIVMMEMIMRNFFLNFYWNWLLFHNFFDHFFFLYNDRFVMMMNVFHLGVRVFMISFLYWHMNNDFLSMIARINTRKRRAFKSLD